MELDPKRYPYTLADYEAIKGEHARVKEILGTDPRIEQTGIHLKAFRGHRRLRIALYIDKKVGSSQRRSLIRQLRTEGIQAGVFFREPRPIQQPYQP